MEGVEGNPKRCRLQGSAQYAFHCQTGPSEISFGDFKCMHGISAAKAANTLTVLPLRGGEIYYGFEGFGGSIFKPALLLLSGRGAGL